MSSQIYQYDQMVDAALRGVVRQVLTDIAKNGLRGAHHFYISFHTDRPDVQMPDYLRTRYPQEITIVLQHQYWDLSVGADAFDVTVSFNKHPEKLHVPFAALTAFVDPSVRFGLQFEEVGDKDKAGDGEDKAQDRAVSRFTAPAAGLDGKPDQAGAEAKKPASGENDSGEAEEPPAKEGAKIVTLDAFRKK